MSDLISVEVVYALPQKQEIFAIKLPEGGTVRQAIEASGVLQKYPEINLTKNKLGIFAKLTKPDTPLRNLDRVEIYRPLIADPECTSKTYPNYFDDLERLCLPAH